MDQVPNSEENQINDRQTKSKQPATMTSRPEKSLKSSEPDLTVIVGSKGNEKQFMYHSIIMASHSVYVDTLLSSSMKESKEKVIHFDDIEPDQWVKVIAYVQDPIVAQDLMDFDEAIAFTPFYDKYDFRIGLDLCSSVVGNSIEEKSVDWDARRWIEVILACEMLSPSVRKESVRLFAKELKPEGFYSEEELLAVAPVVAKNEILLKIAHASKEEVLSPLWPRFFRAFGWLKLFFDQDVPRDDEKVNMADSEDLVEFYSRMADLQDGAYEMFPDIYSPPGGNL